MSLEFTGELNEEGFSVTECVGGSMELDEDQLGLRYQVGFCFCFFFVSDAFRVCYLVFSFIYIPRLFHFGFATMLVFIRYTNLSPFFLYFLFYSLSAIRD